VIDRVSDRKPEGHIGDVGRERVTGITCRPGRSQIAYATRLGGLQIRDVATRRPVRTLQGHEGDVLCATYSPDGRLLASGGLDRSVRV
jgi:WD40 repeat protein